MEGNCAGSHSLQEVIIGIDPMVLKHTLPLAIKEQLDM
jgi:hypothetical protein